MKKLLFALAVLSLAGCATSHYGPTPIGTDRYSIQTSSPWESNGDILGNSVVQEGIEHCKKQSKGFALERRRTYNGGVGFYSGAYIEFKCRGDVSDVNIDEPPRTVVIQPQQ